MGSRELSSSWRKKTRRRALLMPTRRRVHYINRGCVTVVQAVYDTPPEGKTLAYSIQLPPPPQHCVSKQASSNQQGSSGQEHRRTNWHTTALGERLGRFHLHGHLCLGHGGWHQDQHGHQ